ncbi:MAG: hypothetical protein VX554_03245, partial [Candidatus Thermoplasmatota archaeon]|nr:hypothetical protein [Candidatus Thermoplasmatota archaeon]
MAKNADAGEQEREQRQFEADFTAKPLSSHRFGDAKNTQSKLLAQMGPFRPLPDEPEIRSDNAPVAENQFAQ